MVTGSPAKPTTALSTTSAPPAAATIALGADEHLGPGRDAVAHLA